MSNNNGFNLDSNDNGPSIEVDNVNNERSQEHDEVVLRETWWWAVHISISVVALVANFLFLVTVIYNRKRHELKTFVSAVIITISVLDILDVARVIPILVEELFFEDLFRHIFCSFGVFHELAVAVFVVALSIAVCCQAGKETKYYQASTSSWAHKVLIPIVLLLAAGAAAPFFLLPYDTISHSCTDPLGVMRVLDTSADKFTVNLYSTLVTVFTYVLPALILPIAIPVAMVKACLSRQCCVSRFKQPIGETIMVLFVATVYLLTIVGVVLPKLDSLLDLGTPLGPAPLLWELGNCAVRPLIYFMTNPAVWVGLQVLCCRSSRGHHHLGHEEEEEIEVPLSPVTTV